MPVKILFLGGIHHEKFLDFDTRPGPIVMVEEPFPVEIDLSITDPQTSVPIPFTYRYCRIGSVVVGKLQRELFEIYSCREEDLRDAATFLGRAT